MILGFRRSSTLSYNETKHWHWNFKGHISHNFPLSQTVQPCILWPPWGWLSEEIWIEGVCQAHETYSSTHPGIECVSLWPQLDFTYYAAFMSVLWVVKSLFADSSSTAWPRIWQIDQALSFWTPNNRQLEAKCGWTLITLHMHLSHTPPLTEPTRYLSYDHSRPSQRAQCEIGKGPAASHSRTQQFNVTSLAEWFGGLNERSLAEKL